MEQAAGDIQVQQKGRLQITPELAEEQPIQITTTPNSPFAVQQSLFLALQDLLTQNASISLPPTKSARIQYLFFFSVVSGFSWVTVETNITGIKDNQDWSVKNPLSSEKERLVWLNRVIAVVMPSFVPSWSFANLEAKERELFGWSVEEQATEVERVKTAANFPAWQSAWTAWFSQRNTDGSPAAAVPPTSAQLPNGTTYLEVTETQDFNNGTRQPHSEKWTPLKISGSAKNQLTQGWGDVLSSCLTAEQQESIQSDARATFPGQNTDARLGELTTLVSLTNELTDEQKIIAEFWAGGPNTVSPPGMFVQFWKVFVANQNLTDTRVLFSGLTLSIHLFEASRITWALKKEFMEARPIQEIRRLFAQQTLKAQDGSDISGASWMPQQMPNFVTPPFPDFPSGHSTFSRAFANVLNLYFSETTPKQSISLSDLNVIAPIFQAVSLPFSFQSIPVQSKSSEIQPGVVPSENLTFGWNTWSEMAESAGISRQQGGIHCISAHTGGKAVADGMFSKIQDSWNILI